MTFGENFCVCKGQFPVRKAGRLSQGTLFLSKWLVICFFLTVSIEVWLPDKLFLYIYLGILKFGAIFVPSQCSVILSQWLFTAGSDFSIWLPLEVLDKCGFLSFDIVHNVKMSQNHLYSYFSFRQVWGLFESFFWGFWSKNCFSFWHRDHIEIIWFLLNASFGVHVLTI